jgi:hypothetical protein
VIQEAAVARETIIQCGPYCFKMEDIATAHSLMWMLGTKASLSLSTHFKSTWAECVKQRDGNQGTLLSVVVSHWLSNSTLPHDKIYALCGLANDSGPHGRDIRFEYRKSADEVYTNFARAAIQTYWNLDILRALAPFGSDRSRLLPSWALDWRVFNNGTLIYRCPEPPPESGPCHVSYCLMQQTLL